MAEIKDGYKIRYEIEDSSTSTLLVDSSGNNLPAIASVGIVEGYEKNSKGASVNKVASGFYRLNAITNYNKFTVSTVYKLQGFNAPTTTTYQCNILGFTKGNAEGVFIGIKGTGELVISYYNGQHLMVGTGIFIEKDIWNHYVLKANNGVYTLYLNGVQVASHVSNYVIGVNLSSCYVNGNYNEVQWTWGTYDDVIVWDSDLSDSEIFALYNHYFKIKRLALKNPTTNQHYSLAEKTLISLPNASSKNMILHGIEAGKEIQLDEAFDKINYPVEGNLKSTIKTMVKPLSLKFE